MKNLTFSQRVGLAPVKSQLQLDWMDEDLRNGLWNILKLHYWDEVRYSSGVYGGFFLSDNPSMKALCRGLWHDFFKKPLDTLQNNWREVYPEIRSYYFHAPWHEVYDFVEFVNLNYPDEARSRAFSTAANSILERELSAYRFVDGLVTRVIEQEEIDAIEEATEAPIAGPRSHIRRALELFADRKSPDYRNSIKESISAVEALCRHAVGDESATLGQALSVLKGHAHLHPALATAFDKLYGYTSDEGGIRHALKEDPSAGFDEAKFMLVVCSAFVNLVVAKLATKE